LELSKKGYRLIAIDLDGTLLRTDYTISPRALESLTRCHEAGCEIMLCTGRRWHKVIPFLEELPFPLYCALNNGVILRRTDKDEPLFKRFLPFKLYRGIVKKLREMALIPIVHIFHDDIDFIIDDFDVKGRGYLSDYLNRNSGRYKKVKDLLEHEDDNIIQFCIMGEYRILGPAEGAIKSKFGSSLNTHVVRNVQYLGCALEIFSDKASKYRAAEHVMELHGIRNEDMLAFGDDINDLELLKNAGYSVAMGNALPEVKRIADRVTASNDEDGVAIMLEELLFDER